MDGPEAVVERTHVECWRHTSIATRLVGAFTSVALVTHQFADWSTHRQFVLRKYGADRPAIHLARRAHLDSGDDVRPASIDGQVRLVTEQRGLADLAEHLGVGICRADGELVGNGSRLPRFGVGGTRTAPALRRRWFVRVRRIVVL